jgi:hypothetical protein
LSDKRFRKCKDIHLKKIKKHQEKHLSTCVETRNNRLDYHRALNSFNIERHFSVEIIFSFDTAQ